MSDKEKVHYDIEYAANDGSDIKLNTAIVVNYLTRGDRDISARDCHLFMKLCEVRKLNPFVGDAYLLKYKDQVNVIVSKDYWSKQLKSCPDYEGYQAGIIILKEDKTFEERAGSFYIPAFEELVGGWAVIKLKDREPFKHTVTLSEFDTGFSSWKKMKATMIRKVALVQGIREALPEHFGGMYSEEELPMRNVSGGEGSSSAEDLRVEIAKETEDSEIIKRSLEMTSIKALTALLESIRADKIKGGPS